MAGCGDLCSAAKCAELEIRINALEAVVTNLMVDLEVHQSQDIPNAHSYEPTVKLDVNYNQKSHDLNIRVQVDEAADFASTDVDPHVKSNLKLSGSYQNQTLNLTVADGESQDTATIAISKDEDDHDVSVEVYELDGGNYALKVGVNGVYDDDIFAVPKSNLKLDGSYQNQTLSITVADGQSQDSATIFMAGINGKDGRDGIDGRDGRNGYGGGEGEVPPLNLAINGSYQNEYLTLTIAGGGSVATAQILIPMCDLTYLEKLTNDIYQAVSASYSVRAVEEFLCAGGDPEIETAQSRDLSGKGFGVIIDMLRTVNQNQLTQFKASCEPSVAAIPEWWQTRLGADRRQIVCIFRKGNTRTYHSIAIPHPLSVVQPSQPLIPDYQKGNYQGMIICIDNAKFIVNCISEAEANRICNIALSLIDPVYLGADPKIWITERKGYPVGDGNMTPTSAQYFPTGQKDTKPLWRSAFTLIDNPL